MSFCQQFTHFWPVRKVSFVFPFPEVGKARSGSGTARPTSLLPTWAKITVFTNLFCKCLMSKQKTCKKIILEKLKMRDPGFYFAPQDWLLSKNQMPNSQISQQSCTPQHHREPTALQPWASHLISLCQGLHGYKMRIIMFADSASHCQHFQYTGIFLEASFFWIMVLQDNHRLLLRINIFVTLLLSLKSWEKLNNKCFKNIKRQQKRSIGVMKKNPLVSKFSSWSCNFEDLTQILFCLRGGWCLHFTDTFQDLTNTYNWA